MDVCVDHGRSDTYLEAYFEVCRKGHKILATKYSLIFLQNINQITSCTILQPHGPSIYQFYAYFFANVVLNMQITSNKGVDN